jgi:hypothetical protein
VVEVETSGDPGVGRSDGEGLKATAGVAVTVAALVGFAVVVAVLWGKADDAGNETAWARWTFLLAGVEAIAFAAAGWLFGREVNRSAAKSAQQQAKDAQKTAQAETRRAATAEADGRALRDQIEIKAGAAAQTPGDVLGDSTPGRAGPAAELAELAAFAHRRFPEPSTESSPR